METVSDDTFWKLRPGWVVELDDGGIIIRSDTRRFRITSERQFSKDFVERLRVGTTGRNVAGSDADSTESLVHKLVKLGLMMRVEGSAAELGVVPESSPQAEYFAHIGLNSRQAISRLTGTKVILLGLGGTGAVILQHLVSAGVQHLVLVDDDIVESSNLERQFIYSSLDIGRKKVIAARTFILSRVPAAEVQVHAERVLNKDVLRRIVGKVEHIGLCIVCIDQPLNAIFDITTELLWELGVPCIHGGVMIRSGFYGPLFDVDKSHYHPSRFSIWREQGGHASLTPLRIAFGAYNTIIAALIAAESLHYLTGAVDLVDFQCRTFLDLSRGTFVKIRP